MTFEELLEKLDGKYSLFFPNAEAKKAWWKSIQHNPDYADILKQVSETLEQLQQQKINNDELPYSLFQLFETTGTRIEYETAYFQKRRKLNTYAIMVLLEPEKEEFRKVLQDIIWSICNEFSWCLPAHLINSPETDCGQLYSLTEKKDTTYTIDLFSAETAFALSEIYMLTKEYLDPLIGKRIYEEVYNRTFIPFLEGNFKWETETHNWAAVCGGSIGSAAIHLIQDSTELALILEKVLPVMESYLSGFAEDGICMEGYLYWQYGFGFYSYFADLLNQRSDGTINLFMQKKVHQVALFQQRSFLEGDLVVNFSDAPPKAKVLIGMSHFLVNQYEDVIVPELPLYARYQDDHCSRWAPAIRALLWFDSSLSPSKWEEGTFISEDSQWLISRVQSNAGSFAFAAKGGSNNEPHNHNDIGHFILQANKTTLLQDLGSGLYTKDYFNENRYTYLCNSSKGHSVPIINHSYQEAGKASYARLVTANSDRKRDLFELEMTKAYRDPSLLNVSRKFTWIKTEFPKLIVEDIFKFSEEPKSIIERFILPNVSVERCDGGISIKGESCIHIYFDSNYYEVSIQRDSFVNHFNKGEEVLLLDLSLKKLSRNFRVYLEFEFSSEK
ncbi:heparinase II/III domain-containing protein [Niallia circulans]|uniref:heparinase II/III domain-containing protein n=1 Tax=Niallia circulans TaxID=1397 RepID=UPI003526986B